MATNTVPNDDTGVGTSPAALPIEIPYRSRLSWELGTHVVDGEGTERLFEFHAEGGWDLTTFRVTGRTLIVKFRTPIGRELFYATDVSTRSIIRERLELTAGWQRTD